MKTTTAKRLAEALMEMPEDTPVFLSKDDEGYSFSAIDSVGSLDLDRDKNILVIYPWTEGLDYEELKK